MIIYFMMYWHTALPLLNQNRLSKRIRAIRSGQVIIYSKSGGQLMWGAQVAEWLRRRTWNPMGSARAGSNPVLRDYFFHFFRWLFFLPRLFFGGLLCSIASLSTSSAKKRNQTIDCHHIRQRTTSRSAMCKKETPCRGIEPRSPAWQAEILTTILTRTRQLVEWVRQICFTTYVVAFALLTRNKGDCWRSIVWV